jgi:glucose-1-phosphate thymidylyltransferase
MEFGKALILAGSGLDDRPWPAAPGVPKHLFPVANRPILFHNLDALRSAGVRAATILVDPGGAQAMARAVGHGDDWDLSLTVGEWHPSVGLRGALAAGRRFLGDEPVLVQRGDAVLRGCMDSHFSVFTRERLDAMALRLTARRRPSTPAPAPGYLFSPRGVSILLDGPKAALSPLAGIRAQGGRVRVEHVDGVLPCHGDQDSLLETNRRLLERLEASYEDHSVEDCVIQGPVEIHPTARVRRSTLRGPLIIGPGADIAEAYIGPYTSIGAGVEIEGTEIEYSIVLPAARLRYAGTRLESSVIGRGASVTRSFQRPGALRLALGEGSEVTLA